jgi:uncharacterized membrane protein
MVNLTSTHIKLPDIDNVPNPREERVLQPDKMQTEVLHHLDEIVERACSRGYARNLDVDKIATMLGVGRYTIHLQVSIGLLLVLLYLPA